MTEPEAHSIQVRPSPPIHGHDVPTVLNEQAAHSIPVGPEGVPDVALGWMQSQEGQLLDSGRRVPPNHGNDQFPYLQVGLVVGTLCVPVTSPVVFASGLGSIFHSDSTNAVALIVDVDAPDRCWTAIVEYTTTTSPVGSSVATGTGTGTLSPRDRITINSA